jgi:phospholipase/lecithinase/hemolysin
MFRSRSAMTVAVCLSASLATPGLARADGFQEIVVFGDSTVETGNLSIATNGLFTAPPYFVGRFSNGPVWVEVLAGELGVSAPAPSLMAGTDYAWGGAESGDGMSFNGTPNVGMQIDSFFDDRGQLGGNELIVLAAGANDLIWDPARRSPAHIAANIARQITRLAEAGGRSFLVPTVAPYSNSPLLGSGPGNAVWFDALAKTVNKLVDVELARLREELQIDIVRVDVADLISQMLVDPVAYGLTNITDPACPGCNLGIPDPDAGDTLAPNPDQYLWWDVAHWPRTVHEVIGVLAAARVRS